MQRFEFTHGGHIGILPQKRLQKNLKKKHTHFNIFYINPTKHKKLYIHTNIYKNDLVTI